MRRRLLFGLGAACLIRSASASEPRRLALRHAATGARFEGIWHDGAAPDPVAMAELSAALADSPAIRPLPFDPAAIEIAWEVARHARLAGEMVVRSGYRTPALNRAVQGVGDSQHLRAGAMDVEVPAGRMNAMAEAAMRLARGGVGLYARRGFIHLDSGPVRRWNDMAPIAAATRDDPVERVIRAWQAGR